MAPEAPLRLAVAAGVRRAAPGKAAPKRLDPSSPYGFSQERLESLNVADGFALNAYATGLLDARMLAVHGDHVYVTRPQQGDVLRLVDANADGTAESSTVAASGYDGVHGIAFDGDVVFLATVSEVLRGDVSSNGNFANLTPIITDLPDGGQHPLRTLGRGTLRLHRQHL